MRHPGPFGFVLEGWENRSVWGWDEGTGSWWAQLWRNDLPDDPVADAPHVGFGPLYGQHIATVSGLVPLIAAATQVEPDRIARGCMASFGLTSRLPVPRSRPAMSRRAA